MLPDGAVVVAGVEAEAEEFVAVLAAVELAAGVLVAVGGETWGPATLLLAGVAGGCGAAGAAEAGAVEGGGAVPPLPPPPWLWGES